MSKDNYISTFEVDIQKIIDYIFHDISKNEEYQMENFLDDNEGLAAVVENLLDFCLEQNFNHFMIRHFVRTGASVPLNVFFEDINTELECINSTEITEIINTEKYTNNRFDNFKKIGTRILNAKTFKVLFTLVFVLNIPLWHSTGNNSNSSNFLKASHKDNIKEIMVLTDYEIRYMRVDMLDDRPITEFISDYTIPSNFEMRYITED